MAGKLYPPYIDGKVPAFSGMALTVPFRNNRAVSINDIEGIICKLKTVSTNEWVWTIRASSWEPARLENGDCYAVFDLSQPYTEKYYTGSNEVDTNEDGYTPYYQWLIVGLYYKIQIAYIARGGQIGYFSDVGVTKYTSQPFMRIEGLVSQGTNNSKYDYIGVYSQAGQDVAEKEYSYSFTIYDEADNIFLTTGSQAHNSSLDTTYDESSDEFYCNKDLLPNTTYKLQYEVVTNNGLVCQSPLYLIMKKDTVKSSLNAVLEAETNFDNGYISLSLVPKDDRYYSGNFAVARSSSKDNFQTWDEICRFSLNKESPLKNLFKDFTVEQGVRYQYSIQQYNTRGLYSTRIVSEPLYADFEDMFLYDGQRQLKVRFNPNVSSFRTNILEAKQDTIGSKFAFMFRNGSVYYKEFPISGLISYFMDDEELFMNKVDLGYMEFETTDPTSDNIRAERLFKLEVMKWLENGEAKLFRSPTEGNYLVRLMNSSLSPVDGLGRMLHNFSATAYEIGETDFKTLVGYGMFNEIPSLETKIMRFKQIKFTGEIAEDGLGGTYYVTDPVVPYNDPIFRQELPPSDSEINGYVSKTPLFSMQKCYVAVFEGCAPGTIFGLQFESGISNNVIEYIQIGETGTYEVNSYDNALMAVYPIWTPNITQTLEADRTFDGTLTYGYYAPAVTDNFSDIADFEIHDTLQQWYGKHDNIINEIENIRISTGRFYWLKFTVRNIVDIYTDIAGHVYSDPERQVEMPLKDFLPTSVYADKGYDPIRYYNGKDIIDRCVVYREMNDNITKYIQITAIRNIEGFYWTSETKDPWYVDENSEPVAVDRLYKFAINHQDYNVDLKTIKRYIIKDIESINFLSIGRMIMVDCYYQVCEKIYSVEDEDPQLIDLKYAWQSGLEGYWEAITSEDPEIIGTKPNYYGQEHFDSMLTSENGINQAYQDYYNRLNVVLNTEVEG